MSRGGRRHGKPRLPIEACHSISAWGRYQYPQKWESDRTFHIGWSFDQNAAELRYRRQGVDHVQHVPLTHTRCNYGKTRPWFLCPRCRRRVGKLYLPETLYLNDALATKFLCRHCYPLTYEQRQTRDQYWTFMHRAERIAERWLGNIDDKWINRPQGQHWGTFEHRTKQYKHLRARADLEIMASLANLIEHMTD